MAVGRLIVVISVFTCSFCASYFSSQKAEMKLNNSYNCNGEMRLVSSPVIKSSHSNDPYILNEPVVMVPVSSDNSVFVNPTVLLPDNDNNSSDNGGLKK